MAQHQLNEAAIRELGNNRESWCAVELNKSQDWCRSERKHSKENFKSTVFSQSPNAINEGRCQWKIDAPTHREKRHFAHANVNQLC